jgi:hypothetical protein
MMNSKGCEKGVVAYLKERLKETTKTFCVVKEVYHITCHEGKDGE